MGPQQCPLDDMWNLQLSAQIPLGGSGFFVVRRLRYFTTLWECPIIVTTSVQFFETLAACRTARLRKQHQLPGSAVFIDEAHAAVPIHIWPFMWSQALELAENWSCRFVLGSGSLARFWENTRTLCATKGPFRVRVNLPGGCPRSWTPLLGNRWTVFNLQSRRTS
jgi:hypothetical protein